MRILAGEAGRAYGRSLADTGSATRDTRPRRRIKIRPKVAAGNAADSDRPPVNATALSRTAGVDAKLTARRLYLRQAFHLSPGPINAGQRLFRLNSDALGARSTPSIRVGRKNPVKRCYCGVTRICSQLVNFANG